MPMEDLKTNNRKKKHAAPEGKSRRITNFRSFNPTKIERIAIREDDRELCEVVEVISGFLDTGRLKLTCSWNRERQSFCLIVRDGDEDWQQALALSVWHISLETCFRTLAYALSGPFRGFPEEGEDEDADDLSW